jgi:hypothetical protein
MRETIKELSNRLKHVHKRFLELERQQAEKDLETRLSPFDFLQLLTKDHRYKWLQPLAALIAEMDAFIDESEHVSRADFENLHQEIRSILSTRGTKIAARLNEYINTDPELCLAQGALNEFIKSNKLPFDSAKSESRI